MISHVIVKLKEGKSMNVTTNLPSFTIGAQAYQEIEDYCLSYGQKAVLIGGKRALKVAEERIKEAVGGTKIDILDTLWYGGEATHSNIEKLKATPSVQEADLLFVCGGGRAIDTVKVLADQLEKPVFTFPTIASNCAPTTAVCVLYHDNHEMLGLYHLNAPAVHCFANSQVIAEAPTKYIWAGIGDALSKEVESEFSARGKTLSFNDALGVKVVEGCNERLMSIGKQAMDDCHNNQSSLAVEQVIYEIIGTTALTSVLVDNDYNSNLAHAFYYGATVAISGEKHLHGELVCYGVLVLLALDHQEEKLQELYNFMKTINLSTTLEKLDIKSNEDFERILDKCMSMHDIVCSPYEITREKVVDAIKKVEKLS